MLANQTAVPITTEVLPNRRKAMHEMVDVRSASVQRVKPQYLKCVFSVPSKHDCVINLTTP